MRGKLRYAVLLGYAGSLAMALALLTPSSSLAQCDPNNPVLLNFTPALAKPEGNLPQYLKGGHVTVAPADGSQPNTPWYPTYTYYYQTPSGLASQIGYNASGNAPYNSVEQAYTLDLDLTQDFTKSFGVGTQVVIFDSNRCQGVTNLNSPPYLLGHTTVVVNDSAGHPISGATVNFLQQANNALYTSATTGPSGTVMFGADPTVVTDTGYPGGLARLNYLVRASASGYAPSLDAVNTGLSWPGNLVTITLSSSSTAPVVTAAPTSTTGGGGDGQTCGVSLDYAPAASDAGGGSGISNWSDNAFPSTVQPAYLHSSSYAYTATITTAGEYTITADFAKASNMGDVQATVNGVAGAVVHNSSSAAGANVGAALWSGILPAGPVAIHVAMLTGTYSAVKAFHFGPAAGCGPAATSGSGSGFPSDFFAQLKQMFIDFFTFQQADLDAVKAASARFWAYGPFSLPSQFKREWDFAFVPKTYVTPADYWVLRLGYDTTGTPLTAGPAGYDDTQVAPAPPVPNTIFSALIPRQLDLTPWHTFLQTGRLIALLALWITVGFNLLKRFTPDIKI